jgi:phenylpropionate dioxygenase-like ring-hydroxylating dioxygenase large terminal subunit
MFPFPNLPTYVANAWYVAAWSDELTATPISRYINENPVMLYRDGEGHPVALRDRCAHRGHPLSTGTIESNCVRCPYHGFVYNSGGQCVEMPSQQRVPPAVHVRAFPLVERWNWIWIWMGDEAKADPQLIPDHTEAGLTDPAFLAERGGTIDVACRYQWFTENLLDLSHLTFLHPGTNGTPGVAASPTFTEVDGNTVRVRRTTLNDQVTPYYAKRLGIDSTIGTMDREHESIWHAPAFHITHVTSAEASSTIAGRQATVFGEHKVVFAITPINRTSMRFFWAFCRTYNKTQHITDYLRTAAVEIFQQDIDALESIERTMGLDAGPNTEYNCAVDEGALRSRSVMRRLLEAEAPAERDLPELQLYGLR